MIHKHAFLLFFYVYMFCSVVFTITEPRSYRNNKESLINLDVQNLPMQFMAVAALIAFAFSVLSYGLQKKNELIQQNNKDALIITSSALLFISAAILSTFFGYKQYIKPYIFVEFFLFLSVFFVKDLELSIFIDTIKKILLFVIYGTTVLIFVDPLWSIQFEYDQGIINFLSARLYGLTTNSNYTAPLILLYLIFEIEFPSKSKMRNPTLILSLLLILFTQSKTTWILMFVYGLIKLIQQKRKINKKVLLTVSIFILLLPFLFLFFGNMINFSTFTGRTIIWNFTLDAWQNNKLFGYGMGLWNEEMFLHYKEQIKQGWVFSHAHSQYYQTLGETGIVGVICLFIYFAVIVFFGVKYIEDTKGLSYYFALFLIIRGWTEPVFRHFFIDFNLYIHIIVFSYLILVTKKSKKLKIM